MDMQSVSIIGVGRVGGALALALSRKGYYLENLVCRGTEIATNIARELPNRPKLINSSELTDLNSEILFITTADTEIGSVADQLTVCLTGRPFVFHTSGSLSSDILYKLKQIGCKTGSIHPLVSVTDPFRGAERFAGAHFCIEGDKEATDLAGKIVADIGGMSFTIETELKPLYHASAVTASGHFVALIDVALEMLSKCGLAPDEGSKILLPLIRSTVENLETQTTEQALTGTFARADIDAFKRHLALLERNVSVEAKDIYLALAERSLDLAKQKGADLQHIEMIRKEISIAKRKTE